jgi:hypothetical protein
MKKTFNLLFGLIMCFNMKAQTPVYFNIVSHNEISDPLDYTDVQADFDFIRPMIKELCDTIISKQAKYNMQVDGNFINGVLNWDNGASSSNDILEWANNSAYIDVDGHNHFNPLTNVPGNKYNPYKFPDLAKLLDSCGVVLAYNILGGITYADTTVGAVTLNENWTQYASPTPGFTYTNYYWQAEIIWGTATPSHVADYTHFGIWKPAGGSSPTQFGTHDPNATLTHVGGGCKDEVSFILDANGNYVRTTDQVIASIKNIVDGIQTLPTSANDFYTMNMLINYRDIPNIPNFADSIGVIIEGIQDYVDQGKIVWATLGEKYDLWYASHTNPNDYFNYDCADVPLSIQENEKLNDISIYPNPATNSLNFNNLPQKTSIKIYNQTGQMVYSEKNFNKNTLDITTFNPGLYLVLIQLNDQLITKKIIKY